MLSRPEFNNIISGEFQNTSKLSQWPNRPHTQHTTKSSSSTKVPDLKTYLTNKWKATQLHPTCHCEYLILVVLNNCCCNVQRVSVFNRITRLEQSTPKKRSSMKHIISREKELWAVTSNMVRKCKKTLEKIRIRHER